MGMDKGPDERDVALGGGGYHSGGRHNVGFPSLNTCRMRYMGRADRMKLPLVFAI